MQNCYVVKILDKQKLVKLKQEAHTVNEINLHHSLRHNFIVRQKGVTQDSRAIYIKLEWMPQGDLFSHLIKMGKFTSKMVKFYAAQIVLVFEYLHSQHIVYR